MITDELKKPTTARGTYGELVRRFCWEAEVLEIPQAVGHRFTVYGVFAQDPEAVGLARELVAMSRADVVE